MTKVPLRPPPVLLRRLPFVLGGPLKVLWQVADLFVLLAYGVAPARWLLVQNPPSIPTLAVAGLVAVLRGTRLLIDWHNYGWSILAGTRGAAHPFVAVAKAYEAALGRACGDAHLAVTAAMAAQLRRPPYKLPAAVPLAVLHDRPAALFQPQPAAALAPKPLYLQTGRGLELARILGDDVYNDRDDADEVVDALLANPRTKILVSSTSWTPDEDFQLLLDALVAYVRDVPLVAPRRSGRPRILAIITGKGPQRAVYERRLAELAAAGALPPAEVAVRTAFLPMRNYARLLALADLGVCLHKSSSGVDLPMKVVDMFGAGLPVAAYAAYESFGELVREGDNGCGFATAAELATLLARLLADDGGMVPSRTAELDRLRQGARQESSLRWAEEWDRVVKPILDLPPLT